MSYAVYKWVLKCHWTIQWRYTQNPQIYYLFHTCDNPNLIYKVTCCMRLSVRASMTIGRREKWREKNKTTVGWRAFGVLYLCVCRGSETQVLRAKYWGPKIQVLRTKYRGSETQVLRVKPNVRLSRFWNPSPESQISKFWNPGPESETQCRLSRFWNLGTESETQCPFIEVLKPRSCEQNVEVLKPKSWEPNVATRACRHGRIVSDRHGYPLVVHSYSNVKQSLQMTKLKSSVLLEQVGLI
jgi:hypothetical protein